jgi:8-oxo-dGTP pyrophosphatase MutT (NUDIX family)
MNRLDLEWIRQRLAEHEPRAIGPDMAQRRAAVAVILREVEGRGCCDMLFIRRASQDGDPWSGHMAFPGGQMEDGDADPLDTACRETHEEVQIDLRESATLIGQMDDIQASARGRVIPMAITPFVFVVNEAVEPTPCEAEVQEVHWVNLSTLVDPSQAATVPYELGGQRFNLPGIGVNGRVVWGLTYQMLMRLFTVLRWER